MDEIIQVLFIPIHPPGFRKVPVYNCLTSVFSVYIAIYRYYTLAILFNGPSICISSEMSKDNQHGDEWGMNGYDEDIIHPPFILYSTPPGING